MLRFHKAPDRIFMAILQESLELMIDQINAVKLIGHNEEARAYELSSLLPNACTVFNYRTAIKTLKRMLACHKRPGLYNLNDYHYLILYDTLLNFCEIHNEMVRVSAGTDARKRETKVGAFYIEKIDLVTLIGVYFYDVNFLLDAETVMDLSIEKRKELGIQDQTFSISQGLAPHPEELKVTVYKGEKPILITQSRYWGRSSSVYPDLEAAGE